MKLIDRMFPKTQTQASNNGSGPQPAESARETLDRRREKLAGELAQLQFDLGGLTYEMAIRDHYRLDTLARVAARVQALDAELAEVERQARMDDAGASGSCSNCGAMHSRGAAFCWQCGTGLMQTADASAARAS